MITKSKLQELKEIFKQHGITTAILVGEDSEDFAAYYRGTNDLLALTNASRYYEKLIERFHDIRLDESMDAAEKIVKNDGSYKESMRLLVG